MIEDVVREMSPSWVNAKIDRETLDAIESYRDAAPEEIEKRIDELAWEYDVACASSLAFSAVGFGGGLLALKYPRFALVPVVAGGLLLLQNLPFPEPVTPLFRMLGFRSRTEIERERHALKLMRGDYERAEEDPTAKGAMTAAQGEGKTTGKNKGARKKKGAAANEPANEVALGEDLRPKDVPFEPGDGLPH